MPPASTRDAARSRLALALTAPLGAGALEPAIAVARDVGVDRIELDAALVDARLGAPLPAVPLESVPADPVTLGLLELEQEVLRDSYELARQSYEARRRAWRASAELAPVVSLRRAADQAGVVVDVLAVGTVAAWSPEDTSYICRTGQVLGARVLAISDPASNDLASAVGRHGLSLALVVSADVQRSDLVRWLDSDGRLSGAIDLVGRTGGFEGALQLADRLAGRLSHVRVEAGDPSHARFLAAITARQAGTRVVIVPEPAGSDWADTARAAVAWARAGMESA